MAKLRWGLLSASFLLSLGILGLTWDTFWRVDRARYSPRSFRVGSLADGLERWRVSREARAVGDYSVIWEGLGRKPVPVAVPDAAWVEEPAGVEVAALFWDVEDERNITAILRDSATGAEWVVGVGRGSRGWELQLDEDGDVWLRSGDRVIRVRGAR